jgi:probable F420-dependent oxidoreductase
MASLPSVAEPQISVGLPQYLPGEDPGVLARYAARAEELGFAGLWTVDSVPGAATARAPALDGLHALTAAAAVTEAIRLGIAVIVLPTRNPALLARELATIDRLSGGRLTVGVGIGREDPAVAALGLPQDRRALRLREGLEVMRALWSRDDVSFDGEVYRFDGVTIEPKPVQQPLPVWFGAGAPPALRRAARLGDGWMGAGSSSSAAFGEKVQVLGEALAEHGRDPATFAIAKRVYIGIEDTEGTALERMAPRLDDFYGAPGMTERVAIYGPSDACAAQLRELAAAGAQELLLNPIHDYLGQLERFGEVGALLRQT